MAKKTLSKSQTDLNINKLIKSFFKEKQNVLLVFLFGSYASKQMKTSSDVDIGVLFDKIPSFYELNALKENLSEVLKRDIDLVALNNASPIIKMQVIKNRYIISLNSASILSGFTFPNIDC